MNEPTPATTPQVVTAVFFGWLTFTVVTATVFFGDFLLRTANVFDDGPFDAIAVFHVLGFVFIWTVVVLLFAGVVSGFAALLIRVPLALLARLVFRRVSNRGVQIGVVLVIGAISAAATIATGATNVQNFPTVVLNPAFLIPAAGLSAALGWLLHAWRRAAGIATVENVRP